MTKLLGLAVVFTLFHGFAAAQDWPGWRGPGRDGAASGLGATAAWPEALQRAWRTEVGPGYSSPVVAGDRVFVLTRAGDEEGVNALDLATGAGVWRGS